jgi:RimJ/RimL family protein N-acetyltransferase
MELRGADLLLREPAPADVDAVAAACADEETARFIPLIADPYTRADAEWWIERCATAWRTGGSHPFVIADAETGELLGAIEVRPAGGSIGYWVAPGARGRGVATRALETVCRWWPERPLHLVTHPDNRASQRVAEKAGFRRTGTVPHDPPFRDGVTEAVRFQLD